MRDKKRVLTITVATLAILYLAQPFVSMALFMKYIGPNVSCATECADPDPFISENFDDGLTKKKRVTFVRRRVKSTVSIYVDNYDKKKGLRDSSGTGVIIGHDGTVLTAYHVVDTAEFIQVGFLKLDNEDEIEETRYVPMYVVKYDKDIDSAILRPVHEEEKFPLPMSLDMDWEPEVDDLLWHFGSTTLWSQGRVKNTKFLHVLLPIKKHCVTIEAESDYGDSGGPVVTPGGKLVGILLTISTANKDKAHYMPLSTIVETLGMSCN